jgi:transposase-like protein
VRYDPDTGRPEWSPRVRREKIRQLYRNDASGILDEELLDDVGTTLYCRCESILVASDAAIGKVHCPSCASLIRRRSVKKVTSIEQHEQIVCKQCGWKIEWIDYQKTYQHKDLWGLGFADAMREFMARWNARPSPREKMLLIDRLIHVWHWQFSNERGASRPAAPTFIEGRRKEVIKFLNDLESSGQTY